MEAQANTTREQSSKKPSHGRYGGVGKKTLCSAIPRNVIIACLVLQFLIIYLSASDGSVPANHRMP